jgi:hypothetical protein
MMPPLGRRQFAVDNVEEFFATLEWLRMGTVEPSYYFQLEQQRQLLFSDSS